MHVVHMSKFQSTSSLSKNLGIFGKFINLVSAPLVIAITLVGNLIMACRRNTVLISIIAIMIHYIATSGIFFNIQHGMRWSGVGRDGLPEFIMVGGRGQYLGEGMTMSGLTVLSGVSLFLASRLPYTAYAKRVDPDRLTYLLLTLVAISGICVYIVLGAYITKMGWYSDASMQPPPYYRRGPLRIDQGNSF